MPTTACPKRCFSSPSATRCFSWAASFSSVIMLRSRIKLGTLVSGLAVAGLLTTPAGAQNPTVAPAGSNVPAPDVRARMWAATARFVYGDDPALATLRPQLRQTIDSGSVNLFGRHLEDAVKLENKSLPKQEHVMKFQGAFKTLSAKNEAPGQLASSIANRLLENKPDRQTQASFVQLRRTLNALADPNAPVAAATAPASPADTTTETASQPAAATTPATSSDFTTSSTPFSPMLTWVPWIALALSIVSLLVSLFKSKGSSKHKHRSHSSSASTLTSLTEEMKMEVHLIAQREVGKKMAAARLASDTPAKPQAPAAPAKNTPAAASKAAPLKPAQFKAPAAAPAPAAAQQPAPVAASPTPPEPATATSAEDDEFFNINYITQEEAAAPPAAPATRTLYANQQPIDGIFQRNMLAEAPASYTIFELITSADAPDQARFVVTGNPAGHAGYIGSHVNILGGACEYPFPKGSVSRIITDEPGMAQRTAGGDWQISKKARIHFE
jgi:hypothetical protein